MKHHHQTMPRGERLWKSNHCYWQGKIVSTVWLVLETSVGVFGTKANEAMLVWVYNGNQGKTRRKKPVIAASKSSSSFCCLLSLKKSG